MLAVSATGCESIPTLAEPVRGQPAFGLTREATDGINAHRATLGCGPLSWHGQIAAVGERYAREMNDKAFFGHVDPDGSTLKDRLNRAGVSGYALAAETIAAGQGTAEKVVQDWLNSPEHRKILEDCRYTDVGVGYWEGEGPYRRYWAALFLDNG